MKLTEQVERNESKILTLEIENDTKAVRSENLEKSLEKQQELIAKLHTKSNEAEQYSRRNCLRLFGVPETQGENTDEIMIRVAKEKLGINLSIENIDRSHRTGALGRQHGNANTRHATQPA